VIVINIRGTGGSGKSTLVTSVMKRYPNVAQIKMEGRKRPLATTLWWDLGSAKVEQKKVLPKGLLVPGHYDTACGGCDTIKTVDQVYELVRSASLGDGNNVLYEGIMVMDDVTRAVKLDQDLKKVGSRLVVISLTTSIEDCLAGIRARKEARGDEKPLNEKNTRDRMKRQENILHRLKAAGVELKKLSRDEALAHTLELLGVVDGKA
jgi:hypothetical protein